MIKNIFIVGIGGFMGSILRYLSYQSIKNTPSFLITCSINLAGSFIMGMVMGFYSRNNLSMSDNWKLLIATGICGGFTTFSSFSFENLQLLQEGKIISFACYVLSSVILGIAAVFVGYKIMSV
jgi:CrcB protein